MSLRGALKWLNDTFRPVHVQHEGPRGATEKQEGPDKAAALGAAVMEHREGAIMGGGPVDFPPNYVPSQQDEKP